MGWGVCFGLDETNGRVYCVDGCRWRASKSDYDQYPVWPSARQSVLQYFEGEAHRELDMIRDEFPGTAAGLAEACREHIGLALRRYHHLSDEEKTRLHTEKVEELEAAITLTEEHKKTAYADYLDKKKVFKSYVTPTKKPKTRIDEIETALVPLQLELDMEYSAHAYDRTKSELTRLKRELKLENQFKI